MNYENICKFIPNRTTSGDLTVLNFVCERNCNENPSIIAYSHTVGIVTKGHGIFTLDNNTYTINEGDLFFTFPSKLYEFKSTENLEYYFISFTGTRACSLVKRLNIGTGNAVIHNQNQLVGFWEQAHKVANPKNIDLVAEGVLLYTVACVCNLYEEKSVSKQNIDIILQIKKYIEENIDDCNLNLKKVSEVFLYNDKYISEKFKKTVRIGFSDYIKKLRLERAVSLIENGAKNVGEISLLCGYTDPFYFSKVFKSNFGISPKKYIEGVQNK